MRLAISVLTLWVALAQAAGPDPVRYQLHRGTARIAQGTSAGHSELILFATGTEEELAKRTTAPKAVDSSPAAANSPTVTFLGNEIELLPTTLPGTRVWRLPLSIDKLATTGTFPRKLTLTWENSPVDLSYNISNAPPPSLDLKLSALPADWNPADSPCLRLRVAASGTRATGIGVTSTLTDTATKKGLSSALFLSLDGHTPASAAALETAINDTGEPMLLCVDASFNAAGTFAGNLNVSAAEKPDGVTAALTVYHRTPRAVWLGSATLALGCFLALVFRILIPAHRAFAQALLPAAVLRERLGVIEKTLSTRSKELLPITKIQTLTADLANALATNTLIKNNFIPSGLASLFRAPDAAGYKVYLDAQSARLLTLQLLVGEGVTEVDKLPVANPGVAKAMSDIDDIAGQKPLPSSDAAHQLVQQIIAAIPRPAGAPAAGPPRDRTPADLIFSLETSAYLTVWAWVVISFLSGYIILILNHPGFGVPMDYLYCLVWGFGISSASAITSNPAATALGIKIPDAAA